MCGRFVNLNKKNSLKKIFNSNSILNEELISYNIFPTNNSFIIFNKNKINIELAKWGFSFIDNTDNQKKNIINSRLETINDKVLFSESYSKRKCLIPFNGYFEWSIRKQKKTPFFIHIPPAEPMYLAGIWKYNDYKKNSSKVFTVITKKSNLNLNIIHERMPVIMSIEEGKEYINDIKSSFLKKDFISSVESDLDFYPVSNFVNNPLNNSKECIKGIRY